MSNENSMLDVLDIPELEDGNPSSEDFLMAGVPDSIPNEVVEHSETETKDSQNDSATFVGDTSAGADQNDDKEEDRGTEANSTADDNIPETEVRIRGRSLTRDIRVRIRDRGSSPRSLTGIARMIALRDGLVGGEYRRHPTPYPGRRSILIDRLEKQCDFMHLQ